jgi:hypothetical protein
MPRKDFFHSEIKTALERDGWVITDDPLQMIWEDKLYITLILVQKGYLPQKKV